MSESFEKLLAATVMQHAEDFGIAEDSLRDADFGEARQTGFVWTRQPGIVCLAMNRAYVGMALDNPDVVAVIAPPAALTGVKGGDARLLIAADKPDELYHHLHNGQQALQQEDRFDIHETATVDPSAVLRGHVTIGARSRIGPRVIIEGPVKIGEDVVIDCGAIIGCEGLYAKEILGRRVHVRHFGGVDIGNSAFIHAGAVIVRSALHGSFTIIGDKAHVGVMSNIGHDVRVGEAATISSNTVIAGRACIGTCAWIGASANVSNMVNIGVNAKVRIGAIVLQDVADNQEVSGNFAIPHARNMKKFLKEARGEK